MFFSGVTRDLIGSDKRKLWGHLEHHHHHHHFHFLTSGNASWFTAGGAVRIAHYDVIDDVITRKL